MIRDPPANTDIEVPGAALPRVKRALFASRGEVPPSVVATLLNVAMGIGLSRSSCSSSPDARWH
jgi:hypothetical protein